MDRLILSPAARRDAILDLMRSAQRTVVLSLFRCDDFRIVDEVAAAIKRGVDVKVLITQRARGWRQKLKDLTALLKSLGADVRPYESLVMKYHAKYIVIDDGPALVTTLNFTRKCFENTCDFLVLTESPDVISGLKTLFENDSKTPGAPVSSLTSRLIIGPDHARQRFTQHLQSARRSIRIIDHRVTDPQILALLDEKRREGVSVQIIGDGRMDGLVAHGRMVLIDEKTAIIGSIHLSPPSLDSRREVAIVVEEATIVNELQDYFESLARNKAPVMNLWASAPSVSVDDEDDEEDE